MRKYLYDKILKEKLRNGTYLSTISKSCLYIKLGKLQSWSLFFTLYVNLVSNIFSIVSI